MSYEQPVLPRSAGSIPSRRVQQNWPADRDFRILSIDGGGIRGVFPAGVLADFEATLDAGASIVDYFDLVAGTSTGGILALGLGTGKSAHEIRDLYMHRGPQIFPPAWDNALGQIWKFIRNNFVNAAFHRYNRFALERTLQEFFGEKLLGESKVRHVIPSFDGRFSEVFLFKTCHHADYEQDWRRKMVEVALATSAAPTIYRALDTGGFRLIDGGVWANNPLILAVIEALVCYDVPPGAHQGVEHWLRTGSVSRNETYGDRRTPSLARSDRRGDACSVSGRDKPSQTTARAAERRSN